MPMKNPDINTVDGAYEHVAWLIAKKGGYVQLCQCDVIDAAIKAVRCFDSGFRCTCA